MGATTVSPLPISPEAAVIQGIGKIKRIMLVTIRVALGQEEKEQEINFSRSCTSPRTTVQLSSGQLALTNISYLVADDHLCWEDILLGLRVLHNLRIDSQSLLERSATLLTVLTAPRCKTLLLAQTEAHDD